MAWQNLLISNPSRLGLKNRNLLVTQEDAEVTLALEDLATLILDTPQVTLSSALLSELAERGISVLVPDQKHHPAGMLLSFHQHYAQAEIAHIQIGISEPLKKRLWQKIVVQKIRNQAAHLAQAKKTGSKRLQGFASQVKSGDPNNMEAQAARFYWQNLFENFTRSNESDLRNALLNYGYAIVRAALARACAASGLLPAFGLHHCSKTNPFNLADDLIEPFRPFVDALATERMTGREAEKSEGPTDELELANLSLEDRRFMAKILTESVGMDNGAQTLLGATETLLPSLVKAMRNGKPEDLLLPVWTPRGPLEILMEREESEIP